MRCGRFTGWVTAAFYLGLWFMPPLAGRLIVGFGYGAAWTAALPGRADMWRNRRETGGR